MLNKGSDVPKNVHLLIYMNDRFTLLFVPLRNLSCCGCVSISPFYDKNARLCGWILIGLTTT